MVENAEGPEDHAHRYLVEDVDDFSDDPDLSVFPADVLPTAESTLLDSPTLVEFAVSDGSEDFIDALDEVASLDDQDASESLYVTSPDIASGTDAVTMESSPEQSDPLPVSDEPPGPSDAVNSHSSSSAMGRSEQDSSSSGGELDDIPTPSVNRRERAPYSERRNIKRDIRPPRKLTYNQKGQPSYYR